ncbi:MAG TPA: hypothetical protein VGG01_04430 [Xanthobacteraceae bacterium]|jgi:hypothetical protein
MFRSFDTRIGSAIMATFAIVGGLAVLAPGAPAMTKWKAQTQSTAEAPATLPKGEPCSVLEWPNYEQSCQFDKRQRAGEIHAVRIIAVR